MTHQPKIILISGATAGFGRATAECFAKEFPECKLILTGRRQERLEELKASLPVPVHLLVQDIRDTEKVQQDIATLPDAFRDIDMLINNAGLAIGTEALHAKPLQDCLDMIDTNNKGLITLTHAVLPGMVERRNGYVINIGSIAGNYAYPGGNVYCATKAFVNHFSLNLRADVKGKNIRVTCVEPGAVETEFSVVRFKGNQEKADQVYEGYRKLTADHIAETLYWLASRPPEFNVNHIEVMPTDQSFNGLSFDDGGSTD